ncbi:MAG TPA: alpha-amylase/4-alpha-glucanotransferase domain-containing protein [Candidatus Dormibacteraeota bacterium]|nr:alpha-amylase/4-alpha-glucanotransferase domain-containing protein [Candidatus Dormibacteraeota bacterium]
MPQKFHLVLLIHAHQPVGNFDHVFERCFQRCYLPFLEHLQRHPSVRVGLHYSGPLLEWVAEHHPEFFSMLRELTGRGQIELIGGGFYEPILISIPPSDQQVQIHRMADYLEKYFGKRPSGAWLAERVWEPQLPGVLARAGVSYTLVDDIHFLSAGFELPQLFGCYLAEDGGQTVKLLAGLKALRYLLPFRSVDETMAFLRHSAGSAPGGMAVMGDDCEKFGVWPGTYEHCYRDGWLDRFFSALENNSDWLATTPPAIALAEHRTLGRADLPTASYTEMMEWVLPTPMRQRYHAVYQEFAARPDVEPFLRGGPWRAFFTKYPEANLLHKKMLFVSKKLSEAKRRGSAIRRRLDDALLHLLRSQCNDAYWHGVFGGLYSPHLRTALWRDLIYAEKIADALAQERSHREKDATVLRRLDFDADGAEELYITSPAFAALLKPAEGGTLAALDFRPNDVAVINSIQRRPEAYHARLRDAVASAGGVASIHEQTRVKEQGLAQHLRYDRWPRHSFRLLLFPLKKTHADYQALHLDEAAAFAGGDFAITSASSEGVELVHKAPFGALGTATSAEPVLRATKMFTLGSAANSCEISCDLTIAHDGAAPLRLAIGLETVVNFLAPNEPDRYFEFEGTRHALSWSAGVSASELRIVDGWQKVAVTLRTPQAANFWISPIETVSESEEGFERVYQGSQILTNWQPQIAPQEVWRARLNLRIESL